MKKRNIRTLSLLSVLIAVSILLARLLVVYLTPSLRLSFEYFSIILAGVLFGPLAGALVGGISDFLGASLFSGLGFFPPLLLGPVTAGFLAGLLAKYAFKNGPKPWWALFALSLSLDLLCNFLWGAYALSLMQGTPFLPNLILRAPVKLIVALVDAYLVIALHRALQPLLTKKRA